VLTIAIADSLSDAFGMHIAKESISGSKPKEVWQATFSTFLAKFIFAITFLIPIIFLEIKLAVLISCVWGIVLLTIASLVIAKTNKLNQAKMVLEHLLIATVVIIVSYYAGVLIHILFSDI